MGLSAPKPCTYPGCGVLVRDGTSRCQRHVHLARKQVDRDRGGSSKRLYDYRWQKARRQFLTEHPLCECDECFGTGRVMASGVVDHKIPHKGDPVLFWDQSNWCAMSKLCHDKKTASEDGGFGNRRATGG